MLADLSVTVHRNFSDGYPVDAIDTKKSRIVLHELERGWWILASIDLTRLPQPAGAGDKSSEPHVEYSMREVSPAPLLLQQLLRAHSTFLLHHAATLGDLYSRLGRSTVASLLEKYWTVFAQSWDVLLHANPLVDIYNGVKLATGGELGIGVGEEEWGSGEREVLENFVARTEGLTDLVVSRFGDAPEQIEKDSTSGIRSDKTKQRAPWLGTEAHPRSSDGVIFSGMGAVSRRSLATVSQWMEAIFKYGEDAYGVGESPNTKHRPKRRKLAIRKSPSKDLPALKAAEARNPQKIRNVGKPDLRRDAMERNAAPPGIPPSLIPVVEQHLDQALSNIDKGGKPGAKTTTSGGGVNQDSSLFDTDKMLGYLKLGYGSSWTLSPKGLPGNKIEEHPPTSNESATVKDDANSKDDSAQSESGQLHEVDPTPEVSDEEDYPFVQRLEQSIGKFILGLSGDLENAEFGEDGQTEAEGEQEKTPQRLFLRTLTVEMFQSQMSPRRHSKASDFSGGTFSQGDEPPTSASASVDGAQSIINHQKLQVAVYVHQPFIFVFLFKLHTPSLTMPSFYRNLHHQLGPLQKPLLSSTDPTKVALRIADAMGESSSTTTPTQDGDTGQTIYDIIYDPIRLTVRTSIPNIPLPGSLAAEGLATPSSALTISGSWYTLGIPIASSPSRKPTSLVKSNWTRIEALNVHTQMLNTWIATRNSAEVERMVKTGRGWWILWMQISDSNHNRARKEAFLVRKARDNNTISSFAGSRERIRSGKWLLREQNREVSASSLSETGQGTSSTGVSEGVGVDARRWLEGLVHLSR
jgi:hypothetical protein